MPTSYKHPTYDLGTIQGIFSHPDNLKVTGAARWGYIALGMNDSDVVGVIQSLDASCFHKTMESTKFPGVMQDVYHGHWHGISLYIKFAEMSNGMILIQLKER